MHIVLAPQRIDAAALDAHIAAEHRQVRAGFHVVRSGNVLRHAHGVKNGGAVGPRVHPGGPAEVSRGNARDRFDVFGRVFRDDLLQGVESIRPVFHIFPGVKFLRDDHVHQTVQDGHIRPRVLAQPDVGILDEVNLPGIDDDQLRAPLADRALDLHSHDRMVLRGVASRNENQIGKLDLGNRVGHCATAECGGQTGHRDGVSESGAVIHIVRADHRPHEFLEEVVFLVGAARR